MKQTGIVRRIDNLGRIVVPKEIRKTLHIHDGDMIEMLVNDERIVLQKHSPIRELEGIFSSFVYIFNDYVSCNVLITDLEKVLFCNDDINDLYCGKLISNFLKEQINNRKEYLSTGPDNVLLIDSEEVVSCLVIPLVSSYDPIGAIVLFSSDESIDSNDIKFARAIGKFVNKYIED